MSEADNPRAVMGGNHPPEETPKTLPELLAERSAGVLAEIEAIAKRAGELPKKIKAEADLHAVGQVVIDAKKMSKRLVADKAEEKKPHLEANKAIEAFFKVHIERLDALMERLEQRATDYQEEVEAEARRVAEAEAAKKREAAERERARAEELAAKENNRAALKAAEKADMLDRRADRAEQLAEAKAADLTRTRSASGVLATSQTKWKGEIVSMDEIDLEKLRPFLKRDAVETALNTFVRVGNRELKGARIFPDTKATFR